MASRTAPAAAFSSPFYDCRRSAGCFRCYRSNAEAGSDHGALALDQQHLFSFFFSSSQTFWPHDPLVVVQSRSSCRPSSPPFLRSPLPLLPLLPLALRRAGERQGAPGKRRWEYGCCALSLCSCSCCSFFFSVSSSLLACCPSTLDDGRSAGAGSNSAIRTCWATLSALGRALLLPFFSSFSSHLLLIHKVTFESSASLRARPCRPHCGALRRTPPPFARLLVATRLSLHSQ